MCFPHIKDLRPHGEMGYDGLDLKMVLSQFIDEITEESAELIVERPRFAHAVVVVADAAGEEICQASCTRVLDNFTVMELNDTNVVVEEDEIIQRALRELLESRESLQIPITDETPHAPEEGQHILSSRTTNTTQLFSPFHRPPTSINKTDYQFPSMKRGRTNV